jgi:putative NADPH-quinone reductase
VLVVHVPALLKGFIDRVFLPGVGVEYLKRFPYFRKLLEGRSARVIYTENSPQWVAVLAREDLFWRNMRRAFLGHCGFHPVRRTRLDRVNDVSQTERVKRLADVERLGRRGR